MDGMTICGSGDTAKDEGWIPFETLPCADLDEIWPLLEEGKWTEFAKVFAAWAMMGASETFMANGGHGIVMLIISGPNKVEVIDDDMINAAMQQNPALAMFGVDAKDVIAALTRAIVRTTGAQMVCHVSETWMASQAIAGMSNLSAADKPLIDKMLKGEMAVSELPDHLRTEQLMVKVDLKEDGTFIVARKIVRDGDKYTLEDPMWLGLDTKTGCTERECGRFTGWWDEEQGPVKAVAISSLDNPATSSAWDYPGDEGEANDADSSK